MKHDRMWPLVACAVVGLAVAGCGVAPITAARVNPNPPTLTSGPVTIATDHTFYAGNDTITITIVNHTAAPVYAWDTRASCSVLDLQVRQASGWVAADALRCPLGRMALAVKFMPGAPYTTRIGSRAMSIGTGTPLADGSYRLALSYSDSPSLGSLTTSATAYSATLLVGGAVPSQ